MTTNAAFIHHTAIIDSGATIGDGTKVWHFTHVMPGARIGRDCVLGQNVYVGGAVVMGDGCKVQNNVSLYDGVVLEDDVFCGPSSVFTNDLFPRAHHKRAWEIAPTIVKRGASIGANATVVCGNTIGEHALVGAGAVVTGDVPAYALMVGVPARQIGWVCECGRRLDEGLACQDCQVEYMVIDRHGLARKA
jgi:UDP-2-acetamido-3-amino-2,3-dideoxy-glucuronate N-acetyltransferase